MSVVSSISNRDLYVFTKGSPEVMLSIMSKDSVPKDYHEQLKKYAASGFRILAIGSKKISEWKGVDRKEIES